MNEMTEGVCRSAHPCRRHSRRQAFFLLPPPSTKEEPQCENTSWTESGKPLRAEGQHLCLSKLHVVLKNKWIRTAEAGTVMWMRRKRSPFLSTSVTIRFSTDLIVKTSKNARVKEGNTYSLRKELLNQEMSLSFSLLRAKYPPVQKNHPFHNGSSLAHTATSSNLFSRCCMPLTCPISSNNFDIYFEVNWWLIVCIN